MYLATIDCGTTNSRVYIVDQKGEIISKVSKKVGVRDTAITDSKETLKKGLKETFFDALEQAKLELKDVAFAISSGMITSEIGLLEIPHLWAPAGLKELAENIEEVRDQSVFPVDIPIYFIRGIKNRFDTDTATIRDVGRLDFMRGEEIQIAGLLATYSPRLPLTVVILSSHTKFIAIDSAAMILGSITTVSGQIYEAIAEETSIGKSIRPDDESNDGGYMDRQVLDAAYEWVQSSGFLRSLLMTRFLDTLLDTKWYERKLFVESVIAAEDLKAIGQFEALGFPLKADAVLVGDARRCAIYEHYFKEKLGMMGKIAIISEEQQVDRLSIDGAIELSRRAGLLSSL